MVWSTMAQAHKIPPGNTTTISAFFKIRTLVYSFVHFSLHIVKAEAISRKKEKEKRVKANTKAKQNVAKDAKTKVASAESVHI